MKKLPAFMVMALWLLLPLRSIAQDYHIAVQHFSVESGLSSRRVNGICQSEEGYIWLATNYGLNRYDGQFFKKYTRTSDGLFSDKVNQVKASKGNLLWLFYGLPTTNKAEEPTWDVTHIDVFDLEKGTVIPFEKYLPDAPFTARAVAGCLVDKNRDLWFWTLSGEIYCYKDGQLLFFCKIPSGNKIDALLPVPKENQLWLSYNQKLWKVDSEGKVLSQDTLSFHPREMTLDSLGTLYLIPWRHGSYVTGERELLFRKTTNEAVALVESPLIQIYDDTDDKSFSGTRMDSLGRLWNFNRNNIEVVDEALHWRTNFQQEIVASSEATIFTELIFDQNNLTFIGSDDGFFIVDLEPNQFTTYLTEGNISTRAILDYSADSLLVFSYGNTYLVNKKDGGTRSIPALEGENGFGAIIDRKGMVWVGTHTSNVRRLDMKSGIIESYLFQEPLELKRAALLPYEDKKTGRIWVGMGRGLAYIDEDKKVLKRYDAGPNFPEFSEYPVNGFYQNDLGIWIASNGGIYLYEEGKGIVKRFDQFPYLSINHIHEDKEGWFWLSTLGGGITRWDRETGEIKQYTIEEGLSNNVVYMAFEDDFGQLWLPSDFGLMRFDKESNAVLTYFPSDGLSHEEFNNVSGCISREGRFYFGGINGMVGFDPAKVEDSHQTKGNLLVTAFQKNDPITGKMINALPSFKQTGKIVMQPDEKSLILHFAFPYFQAARQIRYAYKIGGIDKDWTYTGENQVHLNRLPYGQYELRIKGQGGGIATAKELAIPLIYPAPFYVKWWFRILAFLALVGLVVLVVNWRLYALRQDKIRLEKLVQHRTERVKEQNEQLAALNHTKDQFFGIIAHDLRGPMLSFRGLNKKLKYLIESKQEDRIEELGESVDKAYDKLDRLLDNLLNWALVQRGTLPFHPEKIDLKTLLGEVVELFVDMAQSKGIVLENQVVEATYLLADSRALSAILRNLINNAIKFSGPGSKITIVGQREKEQFLLIVSDQGFGFSEEELQQLFTFQSKKIKSAVPKERGTGLGLQLCKELMELHNGQLRIESQLNEGTQIYLVFPDLVK